MSETQAPPSGWQDRIVGSGVMAPDQFLAHPLNFRIHSMSQEQALEEVLNRVGWVRRVLVNRRTGHVLDGHLRVALAIRRNEPEIPYDEVDLSEEDERLVLAALDPIAAMAGTDVEKLRELTADFQLAAESQFGAMLDALTEMSQTPPDRQRREPGNTDELRDVSAQVRSRWVIVVECADEDEQRGLLDRWLGEGIECRAMNS